MLFNGWKKRIECKMINIDYPGHWIRSDVPFADSFDELKSDVIKQIDQYVSGENNIFLYGHSMGAILAWEIALYYSQRGRKISGLYLSGSNNPKAFSDKYKDWKEITGHFCDMVDYREEDHSETENRLFYSFFFPIIQNDLKICSKYRFSDAYCDINTVVLYGESDSNTSKEEILKWKKYTNCTSIIKMKGRHMFINDPENKEQIFGMIHACVNGV